MKLQVYPVFILTPTGDVLDRWGICSGYRWFAYHYHDKATAEARRDKIELILAANIVLHPAMESVNFSFPYPFMIG